MLNDLLKRRDPSRLRTLHVAPESFFRKLFAHRFGRYETADRSRPDVDCKADLEKLPFADGSYDLVFASHVLEHVHDDESALAEIRRILTTDGIAILPVPIVAERTVEYPAPNPHEEYHVRAPGPDYFEKYRRHFSKVETISSASLPAKYQPFIHEDRSRWPTAECPLRPSMAGEKHADFVPVCYA